ELEPQHDGSSGHPVSIRFHRAHSEGKENLCLGARHWQKAGPTTPEGGPNPPETWRSHGHNNFGESFVPLPVGRVVRARQGAVIPRPEGEQSFRGIKAVRGAKPRSRQPGSQANTTAVRAYLDHHRRELLEMLSPGAAGGGPNQSEMSSGLKLARRHAKIMDG